SLSQFAKRESINLSTLYSWQNKYLKAGAGLAGSNRSDDWSPEQKFSVVLETAALSEIKLSHLLKIGSLVVRMLNLKGSIVKIIQIIL
ncbi:hypothetical protein H5123_19945, partial [Shewanella sp. SR43-4]|nr:hypothetical protein [Shewanella sp. SR43-4]